MCFFFVFRFSSFFAFIFPVLSRIYYLIASKVDICYGKLPRGNIRRKNCRWTYTHWVRCTWIVKYFVIRVNTGANVWYRKSCEISVHDSHGDDSANAIPCRISFIVGIIIVNGRADVWLILRWLASIGGMYWFSATLWISHGHFVNIPACAGALLIRGWFSFNS